MGTGSLNYVGKIPAELTQKMLDWLVDGYKAYPGDEQMKLDISNIGMRTANGNCILKTEHLPVIENLSGEKYVPTSKALRGPGNQLIEPIEEMFDDENDTEDLS
jgi:hypothetical protein